MSDANPSEAPEVPTSAPDPAPQPEPATEPQKDPADVAADGEQVVDGLEESEVKKEEVVDES